MTSRAEIQGRKACRTAYMRLRPADGYILLLRDKGYTQAEIATEWGVTQQRVQVKEDRARKRLQAIIVEMIEGR